MSSGLKQETLDQILEDEIDSHGLSHVLLCLENLCLERAEFIRQNYGADDETARAWEYQAKRLAKVASHAGRELP